jgi:hypothetical protein
MSTEEKVAKFEQIQKTLWEMAKYGNLMQSTLAAALIRQLEIESPEGEEPESA